MKKTKKEKILGFLIEATGPEIRLKPWEEATGCVETLQVNEDRVILILSHTRKKLKIAFPRNSPEAQTTIRVLSKVKKGTAIALLKTENPENPIILKVLNRDRMTARVQPC